MWLTLYILIWPAMSAAVLLLLLVTLRRDLKAARQSGKAML
ncbi:putative transporter small subunit [Alcaligenes sp. SDU_A2]|nr:putative transporter small subunit [Alcaligenes sp.]HRL26322.1 putative transporter small subunit [Alcaligenes sp.]